MKNKDLTVSRRVHFHPQTRHYVRLLTLTLTLSFIVILSGCLPSEEAVTETAGEETFGGFKGLDSAETKGPTKVQLNWTSSSDGRIVSYNVYDVSLSSIPKLVKTVDATRSSATLAGLSEGFYYVFRVRAVDKKGKEDANNNDLVGIPYGGAESFTVISSSSAKIGYSNVNGTEAQEHNVYCMTNVNKTYELMKNVRNMNLSEVTLSDLEANLTYTCRVAILVEGYEDNNEATVTFQALGKASEIRFSINPGSAAAGEVLAQQPMVEMLDENGNLVTGGPDAEAIVTLIVSANSVTIGSVRGISAVQAVAGVAIFTDINLQEAGLKILMATKADTSAQFFGTLAMSVDSSSFNITPGTVDDGLSTIVINPAVPPATALVANGTDSYSVEITLNDSYGNPVSGIRPNFASNIIGDFIIQPFLSTDDMGFTIGSISTTVADSLPPARILSLTSPAGLSAVQTLAPFRPGDATKLSFSSQPATSPAGNLAMNDVAVSVQDAQGNTIVSGTDSSLTISLSIASNVGGAVLSGGIAVGAINGVASFNDLGIDITRAGYNLIANSGALSTAFSNSFNITAGVPQAIAITGPTDVQSGDCSSAITVQLQDLGGNPSLAVQNTSVSLAGLGNSLIYSSGSCGGSPLTSVITFTPGTDTRLIYLKNVKIEALAIIGTDASSVLTPGNLGVNINPSQIALMAEAALPAAPGTPLSVVSAQCSTKITVTPLSQDGTAGPFFISTLLSMTGVIGSQAKIYSNASCTLEVDPANITVPASTLPNHILNLYLKDPKGEVLNLGIADPAGNIGTISLPQQVTIGASDIDFAGPSTVVAGACSAAFTVSLTDSLGNNVTLAGNNVSLDITGIDGVSLTGQLFTSPSCSGSGSKTVAVVPDGNSTIQLYYKGLAAEILNISLSDPTGAINSSASLQLIVTPSALEIVGPGATSSKTSECVGPFSVRTLDGQSLLSDAVLPIYVTLTGQGQSGDFYDDVSCSNATDTMTFAPGDNTKSFYYLGYYPESALTLTASDDDGVLSLGSLSWQVIGDWGWFGTASKMFDDNGDLLPFQIGVKPVAAAFDGFQAVYSLEFSPDKQYLYVADYDRGRVVKYDYLNHKYIGWIGAVRFSDGVGSTGSNLVTPSNAECVSVINNTPLPGWCVGGRTYKSRETTGGISSGYDLAVDATYVYVAQIGHDQVLRFEAETGAFAGWIGRVNNSPPTGPAVGGPASCSLTANNDYTPGWCIGGNRDNAPNYNPGGLGNEPRSIAVDGSYLYVGVYGAIQRFDLVTGAYTGWTGMVDVTPTGGAGGCTSTFTDSPTPGWCTGGSWKAVDPRNFDGIRHNSDLLLEGGVLYSFAYNYGSVIQTYNAGTGVNLGRLANQTFNWRDGNTQAVFDGTNFFVADFDRIIKTSSTGLVESWMGRVSNNAGMSGNFGCNSLLPNDDTPGWCLGGLEKPGLSETSFIAASSIADDGAGNLLVGDERFPGIRKFDKATGNLLGTFGLASVAPKRWSADRTVQAELHGFDDDSLYLPQGVVIAGEYLFVTERYGSRIKKYSTKTGELIGWIGGRTSVPTGGASASCTAASGSGPSPDWCLGADFYPYFTFGQTGMISNATDGIMYDPFGLATDGTWLYVTDRGLHRIQKFRVDDGTYGGWIGKINSTSGLSGASGCSTAQSNTFTPGWCFGGYPTSGNGDGMLNQPTGITYLAGNIYVWDVENGRISSYSAITGGFQGWIGRINTTPSGGCTVGSNGDYDVSLSGWCIGGTGKKGDNQVDNGGGFTTWGGYYGDISNDGAFLYVANSIQGRIDKIALDGSFVGAVNSRTDEYNNVWETAMTNAGIGSMGHWCSYPVGVWIDGDTLYGVNRQACNNGGLSPTAVYKLDLVTGNLVGWKGGIDPTNTPTSGDSGCAGAVISTPGWCKGGRVAVGTKLGQFADGSYGHITGDSNFIYMVDNSANRVIRIPK